MHEEHGETLHEGHGSTLDKGPDSLSCGTTSDEELDSILLVLTLCVRRGMLMYVATSDAAPGSFSTVPSSSVFGDVLDEGRFSLSLALAMADSRGDLRVTTFVVIKELSWYSTVDVIIAFCRVVAKVGISCSSIPCCSSFILGSATFLRHLQNMYTN